jgi:hypothetical protein
MILLLLPILLLLVGLHQRLQQLPTRLQRRPLSAETAAARAKPHQQTPLQHQHL